MKNLTSTDLEHLKQRTIKIILNEARLSKSEKVAMFYGYLFAMQNFGMISSSKSDLEIMEFSEKLKYLG
ncbi:hypothetical protein [Acinetobacter populi]|uniref:Uncharacterized protein n=1 Tax=Acinetobacter populi TaxID=1582270 RepID=A0A1Z9Z2L1_9GAMM|nr:hypothetical protein [Acinetobacter populi]OUY08728.1 hypothetical protein CAP51_03695 [Acinetobacter populi]